MVAVAVVCADVVVAAASSRAETLRTTQEETEIVPRIKNSILPVYSTVCLGSFLLPRSACLHYDNSNCRALDALVRFSIMLFPIGL